jgi:hypothetical protein
VLFSCSQPLPPDTPEHASALYAFIYQAWDSLIDEIRNRDLTDQDVLGHGLAKSDAFSSSRMWLRTLAWHTSRLSSLPAPSTLLQLYKHHIASTLVATAEADGGKESQVALISTLAVQGLLWRGAIWHAFNGAAARNSQEAWVCFCYSALAQFLECEDYDETGLALSPATQNLLEKVINAVQKLTNLQQLADRLQLVLEILVPGLEGKLWASEAARDAAAFAALHAKSSAGTASAATLRARENIFSGVGEGEGCELQSATTTSSSSSSCGNDQSRRGMQSESFCNGADNGSSDANHTNPSKGSTSTRTVLLHEHVELQKFAADICKEWPLEQRMVLAGLVLGTHLSLDAAALVWRFLVEAEQSGGPAWEEDVPLQVVLLMQEAQGLQQTVVQHFQSLYLLHEKGLAAKERLDSMRQEGKQCQPKPHQEQQQEDVVEQQLGEEHNHQVNSVAESAQLLLQTQQDPIGGSVQRQEQQQHQRDAASGGVSTFAGTVGFQFCAGDVKVYVGGLQSQVGLGLRFMRHSGRAWWEVVCGGVLLLHPNFQLASDADSIDAAGVNYGHFLIVLLMPVGACLCHPNSCDRWS